MIPTTHTDALANIETTIVHAFDTLEQTGLDTYTVAQILAEIITNRAATGTNTQHPDTPANGPTQHTEPAALTEEEGRQIIRLIHLALATYGGHRPRLSTYTTAATPTGRAAINRAAAFRPKTDKNARLTPQSTHIDPVHSPELSRYYVVVLLQLPTTHQTHRRTKDIEVRTVSIVIRHNHGKRSRRANAWLIEAFDVL